VVRRPRGQQATNETGDLPHSATAGQLITTLENIATARRDSKTTTRHPETATRYPESTKRCSVPASWDPETATRLTEPAGADSKTAKRCPGSVKPSKIPACATWGPEEPAD